MAAETMIETDQIRAHRLIKMANRGVFLCTRHQPEARLLAVAVLLHERRVVGAFETLRTFEKDEMLERFRDERGQPDSYTRWKVAW